MSLFSGLFLFMLIYMLHVLLGFIVLVFCSDSSTGCCYRLRREFCSSTNLYRHYPGVSV